MKTFFFDYAIERNYDGDKVDTWTVYQRRPNDLPLEICTCLDKEKAHVVARCLEQCGVAVVNDILHNSNN